MFQDSYFYPKRALLIGDLHSWDYLRRSRQAGFFLPLSWVTPIYAPNLAESCESSGGIDSASSAIIVFSMCRLVVQAIKAGNQQVIADLHTICADDEWLPLTPEELCGRLFHTCEMPACGKCWCCIDSICQAIWVQRRIARRKHAKGRIILAKVIISFPTSLSILLLMREWTKNCVKTMLTTSSA